MPRTQAIVVRGDRVLLVRHRLDGEDWWCLPGGTLEPNESPEEGVIRELKEECDVDGVVVEQVATVSYASYPEPDAYTFAVDIGEQEPSLGEDPELRDSDSPVLIDVRWLRLTEIPERDRAYLWAMGLIVVQRFLDELHSWGDEIRYPGNEPATGSALIGSEA